MINKISKSKYRALQSAVYKYWDWIKDRSTNDEGKIVPSIGAIFIDGTYHSVPDLFVLTNEQTSRISELEDIDSWSESMIAPIYQPGWPTNYDRDIGVDVPKGLLDTLEYLDLQEQDVIILAPSAHEQANLVPKQLRRRASELKQRQASLEKDIQEFRIACPHDIIAKGNKDFPLPECSICGTKFLGWYCADSPRKLCEYTKFGPEECDHCGRGHFRSSNETCSTMHPKELEMDAEAHEQP